MAAIRQVAERVRVPAILALVVTIGMGFIYWPIVKHPSEKKFYGYGDSWTYYGPTQFYGDYVLHSGEFPLWNPLILCGQPISGNPQYAIFYPPNVLRRVLTFSPTPFETHVGLAIMLYAHVLAAALGAYALGRSFGLSRAGAFTAGIAFVFSAAFSQRIFGHLLMVMVVTWLPWCLLFLRTALRASTLKQAVPALFGLGVVYAMAILAGTPQMTLLVGFALVLYWSVERAFDAFTAYGQGNLSSSFVRRIGSDFLIGALAVALAAGFAAPMVIPALEFFADTPRGAQSGNTFEKTTGDEAFSIPELLAAYGGGGNYEGLKTLSAAGLIMAIAGLFSARRREACFLAILALLLIDASLESSIFMLRLLLAVSPFPISSPGRGMMVAVLPLALLVGLGVDSLRALALGRRGRLVASAGIAVVALGMCVLVARRLADFVPAMPIIVVIYPIAAAAFVIVAINRAGLRGVPLIAVCLLLAEAVHWRSAYVRYLATTDGIFYSEAPGTSSDPPVFWNELSRDVWKKTNRPIYQLEGQINGFDAMPMMGVISIMMPGDENNLFWRAALPEWIAASTDRAYLLLKRGFWLHSEYVDGQIPPPDIEFPPTTTVYLDDPGAISVPRVRANEVLRQPYSANSRRSIFVGKSYTFTPENHPTRDAPLLWGSDTALPVLHKTLALDVRSDCRAKFTIYVANTSHPDDLRHLAVLDVRPAGGRISRLHVPLPDSEKIILALAVDFLDDAGAVQIVGGELVVDHADERERIRVVSRTANTVEVEVLELPAPRILSCIDFMYPGWHAYLDGKEVPILRAFTHFKAVEVPAGSHRVRFLYKPTSLYYGYAVFVLTVIISALLFRWSRSDRPRT